MSTSTEGKAAGNPSSAQQTEPTLFERPGEAAPVNHIDELVFAAWAKAGVKPARICSDAVFVRRAYLDVIGSLPTADEARAFLDDKDPGKRARLIETLMQREEFADYWAMLWCDLLRVKSEFPINLWPNAVQAYHHWIRSAIRDNMPYDRFARELLTSSGSNFRVPPVNFLRAVQNRDPSSLAKAAAQAFLGDRMNSWPKDRQDGLAVFFSRVGYKSTAEWKEEIVFFDASKPAADKAKLPDGKVIKLDPQQDPRQVFADWLTSPRNDSFARCAVNRVWYWLLGRGIVHEPDDFRPDNPPSLPKVLDLLQRELVAARFDLRPIYRLILNSSTYQLSPVPRSRGSEAQRLFAYYSLRQMDAEVLADALCQITGTHEEYSSSIPEPFTWVPPEHRSIALPDGSITSSFLELFGRPPRDTGLADERNNTPTAAQRLHLLNSSHVRNKIESGPTMREWKRMAGRDAFKAMDQMYLTILSRYPTPGELQTLETYDRDHGKERGANTMADMAWALVNSPEFFCRH